MNAYRLNSMANYLLRRAIARSLNIPIADVYKAVKDISNNNEVITTADGKKYTLSLIEINQDFNTKER
jgi:hypothetical protein